MSVGRVLVPDQRCFAVTMWTLGAFPTQWGSLCTEPLCPGTPAPKNAAGGTLHSHIWGAFCAQLCLRNLKNFMAFEHWLYYFLKFNFIIFFLVISLGWLIN